MSVRHILPAVFFLTFASACGGSKAEAESPEGTPETDDDGAAPSTDQGESASAEDGEPEAGPWKIPSECHKGDSPCTANPKWVKKLCEDVYPAVALYLFSSQAPFTHGYLSRKTRAVNASGGATSGSEWLAFDEEVVLLHHRVADTGGMQVSGSGDGYEAIRLDGSCVTLGGDEVRLQVPPTPKYAEVPWRYIGQDMQDALLADAGTKEIYIARRQECKGAFSGEVSDKCVKLTDKLNATIVQAVTSGAVKLPQPELRP